nr:hypothetical protein CPGR_02963 [Mycolicibacter nonchromogenicus]
MPSGSAANRAPGMPGTNWVTPVSAVAAKASVATTSEATTTNFGCNHLMAAANSSLSLRSTTTERSTTPCRAPSA